MPSKEPLRERISAQEGYLKAIIERKLQLEKDTVYYASKLEEAQKKISAAEAKFNRFFFSYSTNPAFFSAMHQLSHFSDVFNAEATKAAADEAYKPRFKEFIGYRPILMLSGLAKPIIENKLDAQSFKALGIEDKYKIGDFCLFIGQVDFIIKSLTPTVKPSWGKRLAYSFTDPIARIFGGRGLYKKETQAWRNLSQFDFHLESLKQTHEHRLYCNYGEHKAANAQVELFYNEKVALLQQEQATRFELNRLKVKLDGLEKEKGKRLLELNESKSNKDIKPPKEGKHKRYDSF